MFGRRFGFSIYRGAKSLRVLAVTLLSSGLLLGASSASATPLEIQFSGVNLSYSGSTLSDAGSAAGGVGNPADADPVDSMSFKVGGVLAGPILTSNVAVDISIPDVTGLSNTNPSTVVNTPGNSGYFDLLIGPGAGQYLRLNTSEVTVTYINVTSSVHFVFGGAVADIGAQLLPYGLVIGDPVTVSFSSQVDNGTKTSAGGLVTSFLASGTGEVSGVYVPEPATCVLAALGLAGVLAGRRRS
jgi:hypothetical protein